MKKDGFTASTGPLTFFVHVPSRMKLLKPGDFFTAPHSSWPAVVIVTQGGTMRERESEAAGERDRITVVVKIRSQAFSGVFTDPRFHGRQHSPYWSSGPKHFTIFTKNC